MKFSVGVDSILIWIFLNIRFLNAQDYLFEEELDVENNNQFYTVNEAQNIISHLCNDFYFTIDENAIDCYNLILKSKSAQIDNRHLIVQRDIPSSNEMEGSGSSFNIDSSDFHQPDLESQKNETVIGEEKNNNIEIPKNNLNSIEPSPKNDSNTLNEGQSLENPPVKKTELLKDNEPDILSSSIETRYKTSTEIAIENRKNGTTTPQLIIKSDKNGTAPSIETATTSFTKQETTEKSITSSTTISPLPGNTISEGKKSSDKTTELLTNASDGNLNVEVTMLGKAIEVIMKELESSNPTNNDQFNKEKESTSNQDILLKLPKHQDEADEAFKQMPRNAHVEKLQPSNPTNNDQFNKEKESTNDKQSENAILLKVPKHQESVIEASEADEILKQMPHNANVEINVQNADNPYTGESAKNTTKASKNSTILIVLFVAVLAVGIAAIVHRYIRKHKQQQSNSRSGNLTQNKPTDIEQGTELKPLMKTQILNNERQNPGNNESKEIPA